MLGARFFYTLALWLLLPCIFLRLLWRARKQPEYLHHIGERFGFYSISSDKPVIWLHAVSVGETRATQNLVTRLRKTYPSHQILLTHTTPTGRATGEQLYGDGVLRAYLPYDYPFAVSRFLRHFRPQLGILMETEIWFNLIHACRETGMPLLLLNARMSEKSARNYARFARLTRDALGELAAVAAQTADDAARLTSLGAWNVSVTGNLKFDIGPPQAMLHLGGQLRGQFGAGRKVFLAASTREGEEALLLDALKNIHIPELLLVIVPRHPQRFDEIAQLLEQRGIAFMRRSKMGEPNCIVPAEIQMVLGDSMGEMFAYYAAADLAFIGGSLLPYGGQNLIEACAAGTPVLVGQHTHNFAEATRLAASAGAAVQVQDAGELMVELQHLLGNPDTLSEMRRQCAGFVESNRGATDKSLQIIMPLVAINQNISRKP
ncbi:MAG: lipid IV(A) 3-deoxy-D-manno-octulosonic acid transferase [Nitrosomonadales bacterium]|nr:lipid IV(A) 3-deoxy-D-manno-octulosonic acid transferase [Nitrosomonadales bacterium]